MVQVLLLPETMQMRSRLDGLAKGNPMDTALLREFMAFVALFGGLLALQMGFRFVARIRERPTANLKPASE